MRGLLVLVIASCGRIGFQDTRDAGDAVAIDSVSVLTSDAYTLVAPANIVAYYPMETFEIFGALLGVDDLSGQGNNGTCNTMQHHCPSVVPAKHGSGYQFNGADYITVSSNTSIVLPAGFTVGVWLELDAAPSARACVAGKAFVASADNSWAICLEPDQTLGFDSIGNAVPNTTTTVASVSLGSWHHVAIRWTGSTKDIFLDGVVVASAPVAAVDFDTGSLEIGATLDSSVETQVFTGTLDDLVVYDRALLDSEVAQLAM